MKADKNKAYNGSTLNTTCFCFCYCFDYWCSNILNCYPYKRIRKTRFKKYAFLVPVLVIGFIAYLIYSSVYPSDDFYKDDFESITKIEFPASGKFLFKDADYPDIHGHYTPIALVSLSTIDYRTLLDKVNNDHSFETDTTIGESSTFKEVMKEIKVNQIKKIVRKNKMVIGFVNDDKRVVLERRMSDNY